MPPPVQNVFSLAKTLRSASANGFCRRLIFYEKWTSKMIFDAQKGIKRVWILGGGVFDEQIFIFFEEFNFSKFKIKK
ncbi:MAG: hypothetical protein RL757_909 [Bacteroidota bacterium]|jgi:hypothetical protein